MRIEAIFDPTNPPETDSHPRSSASLTVRRKGNGRRNSNWYSRDPRGRRTRVQILAAACVVLGRGDNRRGRFRIAAQAETFRFGTLDFSPCELDREHSGATTEAWCAPFEVAENRRDPNTRKLDLKVALIRSAQAADDDFIVYLAGGPGQSAIETWPQIAGALGPARKRRHVLLLDQRGTGDSNALECKALAASEDALEFNPANVGAATRACLQQVGAHADPRYYTTADAIADLEDLRQALGAPTFDLVGVSYGTRVAQQYLRRHAEGVRSVILDSVVPNDLVLGSEFAGNLGGPRPGPTVRAPPTAPKPSRIRMPACANCATSCATRHARSTSRTRSVSSRAPSSSMLSAWSAWFACSPIRRRRRP